MLPRSMSREVLLLGAGVSKLAPSPVCTALLRHWQGSTHQFVREISTLPSPPPMSTLVTFHHRASLGEIVFRSEERDKSKKSRNCGIQYRMELPDGTQGTFFGIAQLFLTHQPYPDLPHIADTFVVIHRVLVTGRVANTTIRTVMRPAGIIDLAPFSSVAAAHVVFMPNLFAPEVAIRFSRD
jgi:hypothetical protein